jgi:hypothetical protein
MFKIEVLCDDKNLARVLRGLAGVALGMPKVVPVVNAEEKGGRVQARTNGDAVALLRDYLKNHKLARIGAVDVKEFCRTSGYSPRSYTSVIKQAVAAKLLRRSGTAKGTGKPAIYTVIGGK